VKLGTSKKQKIKEQIHAEMRRIAISRHPFCVCCGRSDGILQGGHLIPKKKSEAVRFDLMNVFTQCPRCNKSHQYDQHRFISWFIREYGEDEYLDLVERSKVNSHRTIKDLEEILEEYRAIK